MSETLCVESGLSLSCLTVRGVTNYRLGYARVSTLEQDPAAEFLVPELDDRCRVCVVHQDAGSPGGGRGAAADE